MSTIGSYKVDARKLSRATNIALFMLEEYGGYSPEDLELGLPDIELHFSANHIHVSATLGEDQVDAEGRERPMRIHFKVDADCSDGIVPEGVTTLSLPAFDLLSSLRNGSGSADNGVLDGDVVLSLHPNDGQYPEREGTHVLEVIPAHTFRPRVIPVRSVEQNKIDMCDLTAPKLKGSLPFDMTELLNFGRVARDEDGILLDPQRGLVLAQHPSGWMMSGFTVPAEDESDLSIEQPVVLSPRMATLVGLLQMGEIEKAVEVARAENVRRRAVSRIAAIAAARDIAPSEVTDIFFESAGRLRIAAAQRAQGQVESRKNRVKGGAEVAFAKTLLAGLSDESVDHIVYAATRILSECGDIQDPDALKDYAEQLHELSDDEQVRALATLLHFTPANLREDMDESFVAAVGSGVLFATLADLRGVDESVIREADDLTSFEFASAIHQIAGRNEFIRVTDAALEAAQGSVHRGAWGRLVARYLEGEDALLELFAGLEELDGPDIEAVSISDHVAQKWLSEARERAKGTIAVSEHGRLLYASDDVYISDAAYQPDPRKFAARDVNGVEMRLNLNRVLELVAEKSDQWSIDVSSSDFSFVVDRIARLGRPGKSGAAALGVARWSPLGRQDVSGRLSDLPVRDHTRTLEGYRIPRLSEPIEDGEHGVLRVLGLGDNEDEVQFSVPVLRARAKGVSGPVAFTFTHEAIHDLVYFASEQGPSLTLALKQDGRLVARGRGRAIVVRMANPTQIPEEMAHAASFFTDGVEWKAGLLSEKEVLDDLAKYYDVITTTSDEPGVDDVIAQEVGESVGHSEDKVPWRDESSILRPTPSLSEYVQGDLFSDLMLESMVSDALEMLDDEELGIADSGLEEVVKADMKRQHRSRYTDVDREPSRSRTASIRT